MSEVGKMIGFFAFAVVSAIILNVFGGLVEGSAGTIAGLFTIMIIGLAIYKVSVKFGYN